MEGASARARDRLIRGQPQRSLPAGPESTAPRPMARSDTRARDEDVLDRAIDVLVSRLRRKLAVGGTAQMFKTIRNGGYQFAEGHPFERTDINAPRAKPPAGGRDPIGKPTLLLIRWKAQRAITSKTPAAASYAAATRRARPRTSTRLYDPCKSPGLENARPMLKTAENSSVISVA